MVIDTDEISSQLEESARLKMDLPRETLETVKDVAQKIIDCLKGGGKVLLCGNGGSAADAQHIATELVSKFLEERDALAAISLTTNTSSLTAIANDYSFDNVFERQVKALGRQGDILIGISTSGNSPNVIKALEAAKEKGMTTVGFAGGPGSKIGDVVDITINVPSNSTPRIQEVHITLGHIICGLVESEIFK